MNRFFNVLTVILLAVIALGLHTLPKFNYDVLVSRLGELKLRLNAVDEKLDANFPLADESKRRRASFLALLDSVPEMVGELRDTVDLVSQNSSFLTLRIQDLEARLSALESFDVASEPPAPEGRQLAGLEGYAYTEPIELAEELKEHSRNLVVANIEEVDLEKFLEKTVELGVLTPESVQEASEETLRSVRTFLSLFQATSSMIQRQEELFLRGEVSRSVLEGRYEEIPFDEQGEGPVHRFNDTGVIFVDVLAERGVRRVFTFPFAEFPELESFQDLRRNATDHLVRDLLATIP